MTGTQGAAEFFEELRREYLSEAPARLGELRKDLAAVKAGEPDARQSLKVRLHRLAGSGGSYGFPDISTTSRAAEHWLAANPAAGPADSGFLEQSIGTIAQAFDAAAVTLGLPTNAVRPIAFGWQALIVGEPSEIADLAETALADAQYSVHRRAADSGPVAIPVSERPDVAVIVPTTVAGARAAVALWAAPGPHRPGAVILIAAPAEIDPLLPPFANLDGLVSPDRIETELLGSVRTLGRSATAPRSVLLIDPNDQGPVQSLISGLEGAAVRVAQTTGGLAGRNLLREETPDLIVVEWKLPDTSTLALVRWVRRQPTHKATPIVVVAASISDDERLQAIRAGVDDVTLKSAPTSHLVQLVLARIERSRTMRSLAHRDDLTGLLNHEAMVEELERAIGAARRSSEPTALLMIDIDHFRRINEKYGQLAGDQVLVHVARLVVGSVRSSDLVARMGGEELAVLCRRCQAVDATRVAEKVRAAVAASGILVREETIGVRVSVGVACYPNHGTTGQEILRGADKALTKAKQTGRDRVA